MQQPSIVSGTEPKIIKYVTDSTGIELWVQPVSPFTHRAIREKAAALFPDIDETPYREPVENAAVAGLLRPASDNPEYIRLSLQVELKRKSYITDSLIYLACDPTPNKAQLVDQFANTLINLEGIIDLPKDRWKATLFHAILRGHDEPPTISDIAASNLPLTQEEVVSGVARFFRPHLSRQTVGALDGKASGIQRRVQDRTQPSVHGNAGSGSVQN